MSITKRVAIIGGGPSGLAAAKALSMEPTRFESIHLFEKRGKLGGLWNYNEDYKKSVKFDIIEGKVLEHGIKSGSPIYKHMETNITKDTMRFANFAMPENYPTYPTKDQICEYINNYAETIDDVSVHLGAEVKSLDKQDNERWLLITDTDEVFHFDAVIIASGHFDKPAIPNTPGINEWHKLYPGEVTHSKFYIDSTPFKDKTVLVVGSSASGTDLCLQILTQAKTIYNSTRDVESTNFAPVIPIAEISKYDPEKREVICTNGEVYSGIESVIFCTGYLYEFEFLKAYQIELIKDGKYVMNLFKNLFYAQDPSIAFLSIPKNIVPFPFSESQSAVVARVFSGRLHLPSIDEMNKTLVEPYEGIHTLTFPKDVDYCNDLQDWIDTTKTNKGFEAESWTESRTQMRSMTKEFKAKRLSDVLKHAVDLREKREPYRLL